MTYAKKVGGYDWKRTLVEMRENMTVAAAKVEELKPAAKTASTLLDLNEIETRCLRTALGIEELLRMEKR